MMTHRRKYRTPGSFRQTAQELKVICLLRLVIMLV